MNLQYRQPTDTEIRDRILQIKDKQHRFISMYQYETLGRISEVAGKYTPHRDQHRIIENEHGEEFVMFIVNTAKRKGYLRPCARPLDTKYDPWAKEVLDYIESGPEYPLLLHENHATSKTYAMNEAKKTFSGLMWPMSDYSRSVPYPYTEDMVKTQRWGKDGYEEYLVIIPDVGRGWTKSKDFVNINEKVDYRWKPVTSHVLRKVSAQSLRFDYGFTDVMAAYFGGWSVSPQSGVSTALNKFYMHMDLRETEAAIPQLIKIANLYLDKLLVPYDLVK